MPGNFKSVFAVLMLTSACNSMSQQDFFVSTMNNQIGRTAISSPYVTRGERKQAGDGKSEFIVRDGKTGCVISFLVNDADGIIQSWRYISAASVCKLYTAAPW